MNAENSTPIVAPTIEEIAARTPSAQHAHATAWTVNVLRTAMNDGALIPGVKLSEQYISEKLSISRNTLRQAFMILVGQNLVEQIPNRGVFVKTPDQEQIDEMFTLRLALEIAAIELAPAGEHPQLQAIIARAKKNRERESVQGMASANQDFHRELVGLAESPRLSQLMSSVLAEMRLLFFSMKTVPSFHARFIDMNEELLGFVQAGEKDAAQQAMRDYLKISRENFSRRLESQE